MRTVAGSVLLTGLLLQGAIAVAQEATAPVTLSLPAQPLRDALNSLARQTGLQVIYTADEVTASLFAPSLEGQFTTEAALQALLKDSGLTFEFLNSRTVAITVPGANGRAAAGAKTHLLNSSSPGLASTAAIGGGQMGGAAAGKALPPAQTGASSAESVDQGSKQNDTELEVIVVTGTHIRGAYPSSYPVSIYDRAAIEATGAATTDQFLRTLPQNLASTDPTANAVPQQDPIQSQGNAFHGGGVNIHGLGYNATLVLLNGHRVAPGGSNAGFSDVTMLPVSAIERIEVVSSGASAIYGADAVAGVVNFVTRNDFDGGEVAARYGVSTEGGGEEYGGSVALGHSWNGGSAFGIYDYLDQSGLQASERDFVSADAGMRAIIPSGKRNSVFLTATQRVSPLVQLRADAFYSDRTYIDDSLLFGGLLVSHIEGDITQQGFTPSVTIGLAGDWKADIAGNYSRLEQATDGTSDLAAFDFHTVFSRERVTEVSTLDIVTDGPVLTLPGGELRAAAGAAGKTEKVDDLVTTDGVASHTDLKRNSFSVFGELRVPLIGQGNAKAFAEQLNLSFAARYDRYDEGGSKTTPQAGLSWSPVGGVNIRGTYGQSFRVPTLEQLTGTPSYAVFPVPNAASATGTTNTIFDSTGFNADLGPEESTAYTLGFDLDSNLVSGLSLSATYFHIRFKERIAQPQVRGGAFNLYNETDQLGPFIDLDPSQSEVDAIYASGSLLNPFGIQATSVEAIFDGRIQNLAKSISEGIDLSARYEMDSPWGSVGVFMSGSYLLEVSYQLLPTSPPADVVDTLYNPPDLKLRGGMDWARGNFRASFNVNYTDSYTNTLVAPNGQVDSWTTADVQLAYRTGNKRSAAGLANLSIILNIANVTDEPPPDVVTPPIFADVGYDPVNASPLGRFVSLQLMKQW